MADAASKVQVFFEASGGTVPVGWSETFWSSQGQLETIVRDVVTKYVPKRKELLGVGARVQAVKATSVPATRLSYIEFLATGKDGTGQVFSSSPEENYDPTQVDLLIRAQTADNHRRQFWLAGLPDSVTNQLLNQGVKGAFINSPLFKQVITAITTVPFGIRWKSGAGPVYTFSPIITMFPIMVRNRKRGRPFFLFHGRRAV